MFLRRLRELGGRLLRGGAAAALAYIMTGLSADPAAAQAPPEPPPAVFEAPSDAFEYTASRNLPTLQPGDRDAAYEARIRALEAKFAEQEMRFASLAEEKKDDKAADPSKGAAIGSDTKMSGYWKQGAILETADKSFRMKWRGRTQFDAIGFTPSSADSFQGLGGNLDHTAVDFRRLRLGTEGTLYDQFDFAVELDFINCFNTNSASNPFAPNANLKNAFDRQFVGIPAPTDVWIGMHQVPIVGNLRIGNLKPANGLEHANSSRFLDFMERSLNQDAFVGRFNNGFQPGILFHNWNEDETMTYQMSLCENSYNVFAYEAGGYDWATRVTWTPINDKASHGRYLLHLGCSITNRECTDGQERIRARGSLRNGIAQSWPNFLDTTIFFSEYETLLIPEIALVYGPWHFQGEYFGQWNSDVRIQQTTGAGSVPTPGPNLGTAYFQGYYFQVGYFLTGEHREYEGKNGCFGRGPVGPFENFHLIKRAGGRPIFTTGAWQILYRYQMLDLNDPRLANVNTINGGAVGVGGGTTYDHTLGLNHFLNPNMKIQYNFVVTDRGVTAATPIVNQQLGGLSYGFGARFAFDF